MALMMGGLGFGIEGSGRFGVWCLKGRLKLGDMMLMIVGNGEMVMMIMMTMTLMMHVDSGERAGGRGGCDDRAAALCRKPKTHNIVAG